MVPERRACKGGQTAPVRMGCEHAQECVVCGQRVRDDMVDHAFFGFAASGCDAGRWQAALGSAERAPATGSGPS